MYGEGTISIHGRKTWSRHGQQPLISFPSPPCLDPPPPPSRQQPRVPRQQVQPFIFPEALQVAAHAPALPMANGARPGECLEKRGGEVKERQVGETGGRDRWERQVGETGGRDRRQKNGALCLSTRRCRTILGLSLNKDDNAPHWSMRVCVCVCMSRVYLSSCLSYVSSFVSPKTSAPHAFSRSLSLALSLSLSSNCRIRKAQACP